MSLEQKNKKTKKHNPNNLSTNVHSILDLFKSNISKNILLANYVPYLRINYLKK